MPNKKDERVFLLIKLLHENKEVITISKVAKILKMENSLRSISLSVWKLEQEWKIIRDENGKLLLNESPKTRDIPLFYYNENEEIDIEDMISISNKMLEESYSYLLLKVNKNYQKWINRGDVVLIKQQDTAKNWDIVFISINDVLTLKKVISKSNKKYLYDLNDENKEEKLLTDKHLIQWIFVQNLGEF